MGSTWGCASPSNDPVAIPLPPVVVAHDRFSVQVGVKCNPLPDESSPAFTFVSINRPLSPPLTTANTNANERSESPPATQPRLNVTAANGEPTILEGSADNLVNLLESRIASPRHTAGGFGRHSECRSEDGSSNASLPRFHQAASAKRPHWLAHNSMTGSPVGFKGNEVNVGAGYFSTPKSSDLRHPAAAIGVPLTSVRRRSSFFNGSTVAWQTRSREGTIALDSNITEHLVPPSATLGSTPGSPNANELLASWGGFCSRHTEMSRGGCVGGTESQAGLMSCGTASLMSAADHNGDMFGIGTSAESDASSGDRTTAPAPPPQMRLPKFAAAM